MEGTFTIETPSAEDAPAIARVHVQGWREAYGALLPERFYDDAAVERRTRWWTGQLDDADRPEVVRVARSAAGAVTGFALSGPSTPPDGFGAVVAEQLYAIYVLADCYGSGAGQALLDAVLADRPAELWVARDNPRARAFYARNGFVPDGSELVADHLEGLVEVRLVRGADQPATS